MAFALGSVIAPILGGAFTQAYNFKVCSDIFGFIALGMTFLYFIVGTLTSCGQKKIPETATNYVESTDSMEIFRD